MPVSVKVSRHQFPVAYNNPDSFSDFSLVFPAFLNNPTKVIQCHRVFLAVKSDFWQRFFMRDKKEQQRQQQQQGGVYCELKEWDMIENRSDFLGFSSDDTDADSEQSLSLHEMEIKVFEAMIKSFYTGEINDLEAEELVDLLFCCVMYESWECYSASVQYLTKNCQVNSCLNVVERLYPMIDSSENESEDDEVTVDESLKNEYSRRRDYRDIVEANLRFIDFNFSVVICHGDQFLQLPFNLLHMILSRSGLSASSKELVSSILRWINHDFENREQHAFDLLCLAKLESYDTKLLYKLMYGHSSVGGQSWLLKHHDVVSCVNNILIQRIEKLQ